MPRIPRSAAGGLPAGGYFRGGGVTLRVLGLDALLDQLERVRDEAVDVLPESVEDELDAVLAESQEIVPVEEGDLKSTGRVVVTERGERVSGRVSYGNAAGPNKFVDYAIYVHENPDARHEPPTSWKFLEIPWRRRRGGMPAAIGRRVRQAIRRAV